LPTATGPFALLIPGLLWLGITVAHVAADEVLGGGDYVGTAVVVPGGVDVRGFGGGWV
jgi:hypothetical protein